MGVIVLVCVLVLVVAMLAAIPLLVSTGPIRDRLASQLSSTIGYRIELTRAPEVSVFPALSATLRGVVVSDWADKTAKPLMHADAVSVELSALSALRGRLDFSAITIVDPVFHLAAISELEGSGSIGLIRLKSDIEIAREILAENAIAPDLSRLPTSTLGQLSIVNGTVKTGDTDVATRLNGTIQWPALNRPVSMSVAADLNGELGSFKAELARPLLLLAGAASNAAVTFESPSLTASFDGDLRMEDQLSAEGAVAASTPALANFLDWTNLDIAAGSSIGSMAIKGDISGTAERFKLGEATLELDGNVGKGALDVALTETRPAISGSLDFATLDIASMLSSFVPLPTADGFDRPIDPRFIDQIDLDLRLSAKRARAGTLEFAEVAASAQVKENIAAFDVHDASLYSGRAQAALRIDTKSGKPKGEIRLAIENMATADFAKSIAMIRVTPDFPGQLSILARGDMTSWQSLFQTAKGTLLFRGGAGQLGGLGWDDFVAKAKGPNVFNLWTVGEGSFALQATEFEARIENGVLRLEKGILNAGDSILKLSGVMPYTDRSLALFGTVDAAEDTGSASEPSFFVGGSWYNPFISPTLPTAPQQ